MSTTKTSCQAYPTIFGVCRCIKEYTLRFPDCPECVFVPGRLEPTFCDPAEKKARRTVPDDCSHCKAELERKRIVTWGNGKPDPEHGLPVFPPNVRHNLNESERFCLMEDLLGYANQFEGQEAEREFERAKADAESSCELEQLDYIRALRGEPEGRHNNDVPDAIGASQRLNREWRKQFPEYPKWNCTRRKEGAITPMSRMQ
jgi:hypothetical protein